MLCSLQEKKVLRDTSGFKVYRLNGDFLGDYSDYKEIVAEVPEWYQFKKI